MPLKRYKRSLWLHLLNTVKACVPLCWKQTAAPSIWLWFTKINETRHIWGLWLPLPTIGKKRVTKPRFYWMEFTCSPIIEPLWDRRHKICFSLVGFWSSLRCPLDTAQFPPPPFCHFLFPFHPLFCFCPVAGTYIYKLVYTEKVSLRPEGLGVQVILLYAYCTVQPHYWYTADSGGVPCCSMWIVLYIWPVIYLPIEITSPVCTLKNAK